MKWYIKVLKQYADFRGRARRMEYWMFTLFHFLFAITAIFLDAAANLKIGIYSLYMLAMFIPGLAVTVRRLHDTGKSGWMILVALIPLIGWIWFLVLLFTEGQSFENKYGLNPKDENTVFDFERK
jgi:uncharacterized membrane protein YhaH (DUF805 family)